MAKSKKSSGGFITRICTIALAVLSFVAMAFKFGSAKSDFDSQSFDLGEWFDSIESGMEFKVEGMGWWNTAKIFMIIALVIVGILAVIAILQFFMDNKIFSLLMKFGGIAGIVVAVVFVVTLVAGCISLSSDYVSYLPHAGSILLAIGTIGASVCATLSAKK